MIGSRHSSKVWSLDFGLDASTEYLSSDRLLRAKLGQRTVEILFEALEVEGCHRGNSSSSRKKLVDTGNKVI